MITDDKPEETVGKPSDCNEQEREILKYVFENGSIKSKQVGEILNIKESRTRELLRVMVEKKFIEKHGQGRSTFYTIMEKEGKD